MGRMVETTGGVEYRARRSLDVSDLKYALLHAVGQDVRDLVDNTILVRLYNLAGLLRQRQVGPEHFGVIADLFMLDRKHRAQPALQPGGRRPGRLCDLL